MRHQIEPTDIVWAATLAVEAIGEYVAGDSFTRIAVIDAQIVIRIDDRISTDLVEIEYADEKVFAALVVNPADFDVLLYKSDKAWESTLLQFVTDLEDK